MKYTDIKELSKNELAKKQKALIGELFTLKMKNSLGQLANPIEIRDMRKDIARINTAMTEAAAKTALPAAKTAKKK